MNGNMEDHHDSLMGWEGFFFPPIFKSVGMIYLYISKTWEVTTIFEHGLWKNNPSFSPLQREKEENNLKK